MDIRKYFYLFLFSICYFASYGQVTISVNLNVKHSVEEVAVFDRAKFITIHANQTENEWDGDNFTTDLRNDFLNGYNVYLGRDTGGITWNLNQVSQDPSRSGFVNPSEITTRGINSQNNFASKTALHQYENRKNLVIAGQLNPFWTGTDQNPTAQGWFLKNATATGEYMGRYINEFHGGNGQKTPAYVEVINEPAYKSLGGKLNYTNSIQEIADFHVEVADAIRVQAPNTKIGGYTTAFPDFEVGDFQRWNNRWKLFMDVAGSKMDFWSIHLYDFGSIRNGQKELRSGSNIEATFDMLEHYSKLSFDKVKPFVISEYGAQMHDYAQQKWSPYRDWLHIKASNSQLMSFLERPNTIASAINFIIVKAEWGYNSQTGVPYNHRLMRKANEPESYTGEWVYTDMVKFYELWQNVNGTRIDTTTNDLDIQVDAYVDGTKGYIILNNLNFESTTINLNVFNKHSVVVNSILKRHLTLVGNVPTLEENTLTSDISSVELGAESTMILEYTFDSAITIDETSEERKYYATSYLKPIAANQEQSFNINTIVKNTYGEAVLRVGIGREHGKSLHPVVKVNNTTIDVPTDWRGYDQAERERFFGVLEIPVDFDLLQTDNTISVTFSDTGGHISSVSLQVFNFSDNIRVISPEVILANNYKIKSTSETCPNSKNGIIEINTELTQNYKVQISSVNYNRSFEFNNNLEIKNLGSGIYTIKITIPEFTDYKSEFIVEVAEPDVLLVESKVNITSKKISLKLSGSTIYNIDLNGVKTTFYQNEIELPLLEGSNTLNITTDKKCQGAFKEVILLENSMLIYPNPASDFLTVTVPSEITKGELLFFNTMGSLIKTHKISGIQNTIEIQDIPSGFYIVCAITENQKPIQLKVLIK